MMREAPPIEEAPVARAGPRSPDVFYRGEEAGAALKSDSDIEMLHLQLKRQNFDNTDKTVGREIIGSKKCSAEF